MTSHGSIVSPVASTSSSDRQAAEELGEAFRMENEEIPLKAEEESLRAAIKEVDESIALIAEDDKQEYLEAKKLAPHLVENETNPLRFLRTDDGNPWNAAYRLTLYWKYRKEVFGPRWLLPMNLSGYGALSPGDVDMMKQDVIVVQKGPCQSVVVYVDFLRAPEQDRMFAYRSLFYTVTAMGDVETETRGVFVIKTIAPQLFLRRHNNKGLAWELVRKALPLRIREIFLVGRQTSHMSDCLIRFSVNMVKMVSEFFLGKLPKYISDSNIKEAHTALVAHGVPEQCIPYFLGGHWDLRGIPIDRGVHQVPSPLSSTPENIGSLCTVSPDNTAGAKPKRKRGRPPKDTSIVCTEDLREECEGHEEFTKKRNALYSRRLYRKKMREQDDLQRKVQSLSSENERLKMEGGRLEGLIADAKLQIAFADDDIFGKASAVNPDFASSAPILPVQSNPLL